MFNSNSSTAQTISQAATVLNGCSFAWPGREAGVCIEKIPCATDLRMSINLQQA
jgi:hypothetical protein